jgi:hypothetical protein
MPQTLKAVLTAKPRKFQGVIPYEEFVLHPAFGKEVKNVGSYVLTSDDKLLRRQSSPQVEEMEIGRDTITIRRNGKTVAREIPNRMKPFFDLLQAAILDHPLTTQDTLQHQLQVTPNGWRADITLPAKNKGMISFAGCGKVLHSIGLKLHKGQERTIRFRTQ